MGLHAREVWHNDIYCPPSFQQIKLLIFVWFEFFFILVTQNNMESFEFQQFIIQPFDMNYKKFLV